MRRPRTKQYLVPGFPDGRPPPADAAARGVMRRIDPSTMPSTGRAAGVGSSRLRVAASGVLPGKGCNLGSMGVRHAGWLPHSWGLSMKMGRITGWAVAFGLVFANAAAGAAETLASWLPPQSGATVSDTDPAAIQDTHHSPNSRSGTPTIRAPWHAVPLHSRTRSTTPIIRPAMVRVGANRRVGAVRRPSSAQDRPAFTPARRGIPRRCVDRSDAPAA